MSFVVAYALAIVGSYVLFKIVSAFMQVRADENEEVAGLDIVEHGERGYAQAIMTGSPLLSADAPDLSMQASVLHEPILK